MKWLEILFACVIGLIAAAVGGVLLLAMYAQAASVILSLVASAGVIGTLCLVMTPLTILMGWLWMLWERRRILGLHMNWVLGRVLWTLWLAAGWLILLGSTGTAVWALVDRQWWVLAFALPPTVGSWCMRAWLLRYWRKPEQSGIGVPRSRANGPLRDDSNDILF